MKLRDVAKAAGVSPAAVGYALNGSKGVSEATRARIIAVADELGYVVNPLGRSLRTGTSGIIGLLVRELANPFFLDVISAAQHTATEYGLSVLTLDTDGSPELELEHVRRLAALSADALIIAPTGTTKPMLLWERLVPHRKLVVMNALSPETERFSTAAPDRRVAVMLSLSHLAGLGHRKIAFLEINTIVAGDTERRQVISQVAAERGLEMTVVEVPPDLAAARTAIQLALGQDFGITAIMCNSDHYALAAYEAVRGLGLRVGTDVSIIGQDDLPYASQLGPPLTTIRVDRRAIGRMAVHQAVGADQPHEFRSDVELVVRESTGPAK